MLNYSEVQLSAINLPFTSKVMIRGIAGTGKTTAAIGRLLRMVDEGIPTEQILLLAPQRTLLSPYKDALESYRSNLYGEFPGMTIGGLARRLVELFWPIVSGDAGFSNPDLPPIFLTLESTQYYISKVVNPLLAEGYFSSVTIDRNRLYSQIIDNINKAALGCFSFHEIGDRLKSAWAGDKKQYRIFDDAQSAAELFRTLCLEHNLLDFSLQLDVFRNYIWANPLCVAYLTSSYRHIIAENIDEDIPLSHFVLSDWIPQAESVFLVYDQNGGFRRFLGANPKSAIALADLCESEIIFQNSFIMQPEVQALDSVLNIGQKEIQFNEQIHDFREALEFEYTRFFPEMLDWAASEIANLISNQSVQPDHIAVLSPFLSDSLRFSLTQALEKYAIPVRSLRPSRSLIEEPIAQALLNIALLAHPNWFLHRDDLDLTAFDIAYLLTQFIEDFDLVRAQLLANQLFRKTNQVYTLAPFQDLPETLKQRITFELGNRYEVLREWISHYQQQEPQELDHFFSLIFGELLSQPGFGFHQNFSAGEITANMIESIYKFRRVIFDPDINPGLEYITTLKSGIIASQYLRSWSMRQDNAVLVAPAFTFLTSNSAVDYQFWLDIGSSGWAERIYQPVTHPYVLNTDWEVGRVWTDEDEVRANQSALQCQISGLVARCRKKIFLGLSDLGEQGYEQRGILLQVFQNILRNHTQNG